MATEESGKEAEVPEETAAFNPAILAATSGGSGFPNSVDGNGPFNTEIGLGTAAWIQGEPPAAKKEEEEDEEK